MLSAPIESEAVTIQWLPKEHMRQGQPLAEQTSPATSPATRPTPRMDEYDDIVTLLYEHRNALLQIPTDHALSQIAIPFDTDTPIDASANALEAQKPASMATVRTLASFCTGEVILWMAEACMGQNHLWQDMGLPNREALSLLIKTHFPTLFAKNTGNMKWKKFFYKQLCEREEIMICKSPSCSVCVDYQLCFGPEDDVR